MIEKYGHSLFNFILVYTNVLIGKTILRKSVIFDLNKQQLKRFTDRLINLKRRTVETLTDYYYFKESLSVRDKVLTVEEPKLEELYQLSKFFKILDEEIQENKRIHSSELFRIRRGQHFFDETKIVLVFSLLMSEQIEIDKKDKEIVKKCLSTEGLDNLFFNIDALKKEYNNYYYDYYAKRILNKFSPIWDDIFDLTNWLNAQTSYFLPLNDKNKEEIKERIRKTSERNIPSLMLFDLLHFCVQSLFKKTSENNVAVIKFGENEIARIYPVISVEFGIKQIKIGELRGNNIVYTKYTKNNSDFEPTSIEKINNDNTQRTYEIRFPNGKKFTV